METSLKGDANCEVVFQPSGKRVNVEAGTTLLEAGRQAGLILSASCGGVGICGQCRVHVIEGNVGPPSDTELKVQRSAHWPTTARLACEARIASSVLIEVPPETLNREQRLQLHGVDREFPLGPAVTAVSLRAEPPTLNDSRSDFCRITDALNEIVGARDWKIQPRAAAQLSRLAREHNWRLSVFLRNNEVIGVARSDRAPLGIAVDIGCTKIAAYLLNLNDGKQLAVAGAANSQLSFGEDLISRLVYSNRGTPQAKQLARIVRETIEVLAQQMCGEATLEMDEIVDACFVGNTAMTHFLLELPVGQLLHAPFLASFDGDLDIPAHDLHFDFAPGARVHILPGIGGFVGSDHVAMALAHAIDRTAEITIGIDIGTNTEIVLRNPAKGDFVVTSVPSGPAFEGGHVSNGMRASAGAIERVFSRDGQLEFVTIGNTPPIGFCGSGVVDLLAELWRLGYINERGKLLEGFPGIRHRSTGAEIVAVPASLSGNGQDITLTQRDITELQLAKAAIHAGISTLLELTDTKVGDVQEVAVAGAFGSYLDLRSAVAIGLLPKLPNARYLQIGNAAGTGAKMAVLSKAERERARAIARNATRIELKQHRIFDRLLARATRFPAK